MNQFHLIVLLLCFAIKGHFCYSQNGPPLIYGIELDALPFATGGYFGAVFVGKEHWRIRALAASVHKPNWTTKKDFRNHHINAYALTLDYFTKDNWSGWWAGGGPVFWQSNIQGSINKEGVTFSNYLINGSLGYNFIVGSHFYISPWAGMSIKIAGDSNIAVQNQTYNLPLLNPELSLKIGFKF